MGGWRGVAAKARIASELLRFLWERKLWWLLPMVFVLLLFGMALIFAQGTALAPLIYTLF